MINRSHDIELKRKEWAIDRVTERLKNNRRKAEADKIKYQKDINQNDRRLEFENDKKQKLSKENKELSAANARLKKSIVRRNENVRIVIDENQELPFQLKSLFNEADNKPLALELQEIIETEKCSHCS